MSIDGIEVYTAIIPQPGILDMVNYTLSHQYELYPYESLTTAKFAESSNLTGLLYVPTLDSPNTACGNTSNFTIPGNVTTLASLHLDLTTSTYPFAIFPWTNAVCAQAYLMQAKLDNAVAALTFQPNGPGGTYLAKQSDSSWNLESLTDWNVFPVYATSTEYAMSTLHDLSLYSGNMSSAPFGDRLTQLYGSQNFPRRAISVYFQNSHGVPSWALALIIVVAIVAIVGGIIVTNYFFLRRRRRDLRWRLQRGEVNLEWLGIQKLNVPQKQIDAMPSYTYTGLTSHTAKAYATRHGGSLSEQQQPEDASLDPPARSVHEVFSASSQLSCPICLDSFISGETNVRELPCKHIFHPECIDIYLRDTSSLCPMCKKSALSPDACPVEVTDQMVHRERIVQRLYDRHQQRLAASASQTPAPPPGERQGIFDRLSIVSTIHSRTGSGSGSHMADQAIHHENAPDDVEMTAVDASPGRNVDHLVAPTDLTAGGVSARRAWHRERLARQQQQFFTEASETARRADEDGPLWRRITGRIIPGIN